MDFADFIQLLKEDFCFDTEDLTPETPFSQMDVDELDMIDIAMAVEDKYKIKIAEDALSEITYISDFIRFVNLRI